ncbi:unnamed protein product [Ectocarpus sp. 12 AP-2014]|nr:hypothetical protein [Mameliella sp.]|tara:strand:+ start:5155 stop:5601 length:447 start_codon:yes stop_codon:yes gene_type:complete
MSRILVALAAITIAVFFQVEAASYPRVAARLPTLISYFMIGLALIAIAQQVVAWRRLPEDANRFAIEFPEWDRILSGAIFIALTTSYAWAITTIGYLIATPAFLLSTLLIFRATNLWIILLTSAGVTFAIWVIFVNFLRLPIPLLPGA